MPNEKKAFFKSEVFKNTAKRAYELVMRGLKTYQDVVKQHLEDGELIEVDETKMEAIEHFLTDQTLLKNFRLGKFIK